MYGQDVPDFWHCCYGYSRKEKLREFSRYERTGWKDALSWNFFLDTPQTRLLSFSTLFHIPGPSAQFMFNFFNLEPIKASTLPWDPSFPPPLSQSQSSSLFPPATITASPTSALLFLPDIFLHHVWRWGSWVGNTIGVPVIAAHSHGIGYHRVHVIRWA